ncbi:hypothetical protein ACTPEM_24285, partial [Clostridioides difficile]
DFKEKEQLSKVMQDELRPKEIRFFQIGVCIGAHAGPGVTGIIYKDSVIFLKGYGAVIVSR